MENKTYRILNNFDIKIIGIILMFIDHLHEILYSAGIPNWIDWFGRPVATIFFFISVEGFTHTSNQKRYLSRLLIGFWVMNLGSYLIQHFFTVGDLALSNNIFTDLFIAVLTMYGIQQLGKGRQQKNKKNILIGLSAMLLPILSSLIVLQTMSSSNSSVLDAGVFFSMIVPNILMAENSIFLYLGVLLYLSRHHRSWQYFWIILVAFLTTASTSGLTFSHLLTQNYQWMMIFAIIPIMLYNGKKGRNMRSFFYVFYPTHIWILYLIAYAIGLSPH